MVLSISLTGCFDIEERVTLNKNGTGNYAIKMDMSEVGGMIQSFMDSQSEEGEGGQDMFQSMDSSFQAMAAKLRSIEGISNVRKASENYVFEISYDFDNVDRIYEAQSALSEEGEAGGLGASSERQFLLNAKKRIFSRLDAPIEDVLGDDFSLGEEDDESGAAMAEMMLKDLRLAQDAAQSADADTPIGRAAQELYAQFVENEDGMGRDFSAMLPRFEKRGHTSD